MVINVFAVVLMPGDLVKQMKKHIKTLLRTAGTPKSKQLVSTCGKHVEAKLANIDQSSQTKIFIRLPPR